jgi:hypothetical protein
MSGDGSDDARPVGLGIHQGVELLLGIFLVISSTRVPGDDGGVVLGFGVTLLVLPAITAGPLAALRILGPTVHRVLDMVLVMAAIASPFLPLGVEGNADLILVLAGLALAVLTRSTLYAPRHPRRRSPGPTGPPLTSAPPPAPVAPPTSAWARGLGTAAGRARTQLPRQAGRVVGRMKKGRP